MAGQGFAAERFPGGLMLGGLLGDGLALLEDSGCVIKVAQRVTVEGGGEVAAGAFGALAGIGQRKSAAGADAEAGAGSDVEDAFVSEGAGLSGREWLAVEGDFVMAVQDFNAGGHGVEGGEGLSQGAVELAEGFEVLGRDVRKLREAGLQPGDFGAQGVGFSGAGG